MDINITVCRRGRGCGSVYDDVDDTGAVQRGDNFGHENISNGSHPRKRMWRQSSPPKGDRVQDSQDSVTDEIARP